MRINRKDPLYEQQLSQLPPDVRKKLEDRLVVLEAALDQVLKLLGDKYEIEIELTDLIGQPGHGDNGGFKVMLVQGLDGDKVVRIHLGNNSAHQYAASDGASIDYRHSGSARSGKSHRGVLHPSEYVDTEEMQRQLEAEFGYTLTEVREAFAPGPLPARLRERRDHLDQVMRQIKESGGNMTQLARYLGISPRTVARAAKRHG